MRPDEAAVTQDEAVTSPMLVNHGDVPLIKWGVILQWIPAYAWWHRRLPEWAIN